MLCVEFDGIAFEVPEGTTLAITGPSGAGKTTLLRAIAGLHRGARVTNGDDDWTGLPPERRPVGFVFQDHALFPHLSARGNVAYAARSPARADELLARFGVAHRAHAKPRELSGGERQRVALARALARDPQVLLLDEPLSSLDVRSRADATRALAALLRVTHVPAVLVTHDFAEAATLADRIAVLDDGRIVQTGTAQELAARPASAFVADLTGAVVLTGTAHPEGELTRVDLDGGGSILSTDAASGPVAATIHPWEISIGDPATTSARNRIDATVGTVTTIGSRVRLGLDAPQPLVAEVTAPAVQALAITTGSRVTASFKASATRLVPR